MISCGGIGATPDDHTRQAAAAALGVPLNLHPQAAALISERCAEMARKGHGTADMSTPENQQRLKMGDFPSGAAIIPNPFNRIPGFSMRNHWFVPGFPVMAWPMIEWVLDTHYAQYFNSQSSVERSLIVFEVAESLLTPLMEDVELRFPGVHSFSLPSVGDGADGKPARRHVELGVRGAEEVDHRAGVRPVARRRAGSGCRGQPVTRVTKSSVGPLGVLAQGRWRFRSAASGDRSGRDGHRDGRSELC